MVNSDFKRTSLNVPFSPACTTPTKLPSLVAINTGTQSAWKTPKATFEDVVYKASALTPLSKESLPYPL